MKKTKLKKKAKKREKTKVVTITMDRALKEKLQKIADDASTTIDIVAQVLIVCTMQGRKAADEAMLKDACTRVMELEAMLCRCRQVMEANDPGNALTIFGPPTPPPTRAEDSDMP